jgi:hypothetical protein
VRLLLALCVCAAGSGCLGPAGTGPSTSTLPALADYEGCAFTFPDGSPVDCQGTVPKVSPEAGPPAGWVCVNSFPDTPPRWSLWRSTTGGLPEAPTLGQDFGVGWETKTDKGLPTSGAVWFESSGRPSVRISFTPVGRVGFARLPHDSLGDSADLVDFDMARTTLESTTSALASAHLTQTWSVYGPSFWPVHRVETGSHTYFFQHHLAQRVDDGTHYHLVDFTLEGRDFELRVANENYLRAGSGTFVTTQVQTDC